MPAVEREIGSARKYTKAVYPTFREYASVDFIGLFWFTSDTWGFLLECFGYVFRSNMTAVEHDFGSARKYSSSCS